MIFPKSFIEELKSRLNASEIVRKRVSLKQRGREYTGLCPFHNEKTPSFTVNDDKQFFHCFGCGAHGNIIDFVMRTEGLSFPEAVENLAVEAGMPLPKQDPKMAARYDKISRLKACAEEAARYFAESLRTSQGARAREYFAERGLKPETLAEFKLGFAPQNGNLLKYMESKGYKLQELQQIGLFKNNYEYFYNRVIFPITDTKGQAIAFGGRILDQGQPKYLNSPETDIFHKRRTLYGKAMARKPAFDSGELLVAEGYMDVIALNQAGFKNAVAPLGTAISSEHIEEMWKMAQTPTLCLDGDDAGKGAMLRAARLALPMLKPGYSLKFVVLPAGQDPDDMVKNNREGFKTLLENATPLHEVIYNAEKSQTSLTSPEQQAELRKKLEKLAEGIADASISANYKKFFNDQLWQDTRKIKPKKTEQARAEIQKLAASNPNSEKRTQIEGALIGAVIGHPSLLNDTALEEDFANLEFLHLEIDKMRENILNSIISSNGEVNINIGEIAANLPENVAKYVAHGKNKIKKAANPHRVWSDFLSSYHEIIILEETENNEINPGSEEEESNFLENLRGKIKLKENLG